ncbi:MAG: hypothetical protein OEU78_09135 [Gammaproteobacteria bacterium]|nr:hypothetical protein [Gammaproteobacteria bacterium]
MIRRRRQPRFPAASGAAGNDTDALQTDVMRFMSIMGLCLMAVFALVQSIPSQEPVKPVVLDDLQRQLEQGRQALAEIEQASMQKQQNLEELSERLRTTQQQLDDSRKAAAAIRHESLAQAAKAVIVKSTAAESAAKAEINKRIPPEADVKPVDKKRTQPEAAAKPVSEKRPVPAPAAKAVTTKRPAPAPAAKAVVEKRPPPDAVAKPVIRKQQPAVPVSKPLPARQGFSLRFASAAALDRQVAAGSVSLYGMREQQAWQLSMVAGSPAAVAVSLPKWFHEMSAATVPAHYLRSLKNKADGRGSSAVVWGVQLPVATSTAIASLLQQQQGQGQQGGALVIQGDGRVTLEP